MHEIGAFLANLSVKPDAVRPARCRAHHKRRRLPRAIDAQCVEDESLAPGSGVQMKKLLKKPACDSVMLVGHEAILARRSASSPAPESNCRSRCWHRTLAVEVAILIWGKLREITLALSAEELA